MATANLEDLDQAYGETLAHAVGHIRAFVQERAPVRLIDVVADASRQFDPPLVRDALSNLIYQGDVVLTEDRQLRLGS